MTPDTLRSDLLDYTHVAADLQPPRPCPGCGGETVEAWGGTPPWQAVSCVRCNLVYMHRVLSPAALARNYDGYVAFRMALPDKIAQRRRMYEIDREYLQRHIATGRLLDVGCSTGEFLQILAPPFDGIGIDRDPQAIALARAQGVRAALTVGECDDAFFAALPPLDVVVLRGVIEHVVEPRPLLARLAGRLSPGGVVFVTATPNVACVCADVYRDRWNQFDPVQHLTHFSAKTLTSLLTPLGLNLEGEYYPYLETPYADYASDLAAVRQAILDRAAGRLVQRSPAFWGSMMTLVYRR